MQVKYRRLRGRMYENQVDQLTLSKIIGKSRSYISGRMLAKAPFDLEDVYKICTFLGIPDSQISEYFPRGGIEQKKPRVDN